VGYINEISYKVGEVRVLVVLVLAKLFLRR
jgi:hypothetical protein